MTVDSHSTEIYPPIEQGKLLEFRKIVSDILTNDEQREDSYLIRWLRARNLDISKAEEMLKVSIKWRKENQVDGIMEREEFPPDIAQEAPFAWCGNTVEGHPLFLCPVGRHDMRKFLDKYGKELCTRFNIINMEKIETILKAESKRQGKKITQFVEIMDFEAYSYRQVSSKSCREFMIEINKIMDSHYPEMLRHAMVVNAPKVFTFLFAILKPFIPKNTLDKVEIFGPDKNKWKIALAEKYPIDKIPIHWGGTLKGVDEYCSGHEIWLQGPADLTSFMNGTKNSDSQNEAEEKDFIRAVINPREKLVKEYFIEEPETVIEWKFKTQSYDVGFQIIFSDSKSSDVGKDIFAYKRLDAHQEVQEGSHLCQNPGNYKLIFDNSFSLIKAKTLLYKINVIESEAEFQECPEF